MAAGLLTAQTINLQQQSDYAIGVAANTPRFAVGDVNNDGLPDLVTLNKGNVSQVGPISVFLNNGAGGFGSPLNTPNVTLSPNGVAIRDFNEDGFADLAIAQDGIANGIDIRLGNGTGNFPNGTSIAAERGAPNIASADFNGDGHQDVAICNNVNELRVLSGSGTGTFGAAAVFPTANTCQDILTSDFNVDGRPDLALSERTAATQVQVFLSNGSSFSSPVNTVANGAYTLVTADFNRDCFPDLAAVQFSGTTIYIMAGNGVGGFTTTTQTVTNMPAYMTVGDFNRDKKVDLAVRRNTLTPGANNLTILPGNGSGGFGAAFEAAIANPTTSTEMRLATIDANRDGKSDIVIGRNGGFLLYHGNSALFTRTEHDFDGDLSADLSVFRPSTGIWYVQRTTQGFAAQPWGISTDKLVPGDYDGDGKTDHAVWREGSLSYLYVLNSSNGTVRSEQFGQTGDDPIVMADFDGDGRADAAVYRDGATAGVQSYLYYRGSLNNPNGNISFVPWGTNGDRPVRGDFDGDGRADAAVFRPSNAIWYVRRSSDGQIVNQSWGLATDRRVSGDFDGDNRTDFAVFRPSDGTWYILNSATGTATYRQWGQSTDILAPADYNGDGKTETAIFRPSEQRWYAPQCGDSKLYGAKFGTTGDTAVPSAFVP